MKTKKQFQDIVGKLQKCLPRNHAHLAQELHRAAGETRQEFSAITGCVEDMRRQNEQLKAIRDTEATKRQKAEADAKSKDDDIRRLKREFEKQKKEYLNRQLPFHDTVIDALIELFHAVGYSKGAMRTIRNLVTSGELKLDAGPHVSLETLDFNDHTSLLNVAASAARYVSTIHFLEKEDVTLEQAQSIAHDTYDSVCKFLAESYLDGNNILPIHPSVVLFVAANICPFLNEDE